MGFFLGRDNGEGSLKKKGGTPKIPSETWSCFMILVVGGRVLCD